MLETVVGRDALLRQLPTSSVDDLRGHGRAFSRTVSDSLGGEARAALVDDLRPLLFVTAWKLLDQIVEAERQAATGSGPPPRGWRIRDKITWASQHRLTTTEPFSSNRGFWRRVVKLYARLEEPRNAVIHRQFRRTADGRLVPYSSQRRPLRAVSPAEIDSLIFATYGLVGEAVAANADPRRCLAIAWRLDDLAGITRLRPLCRGEPPGLRNVVVNLEKAGRQWRLDLNAIRQHLQSQNVSTEVADIEAWLPDGRGRYRGRLEDAPSGASITFAASRAPGWLVAS